MKIRLLVAAAMVAAIGSGVMPAQAAVHTGTILLPAPEYDPFIQGFGASDLLVACFEEDDVNGVDGYVITLAANELGEPFTLAATDDLAGYQDLGVQFYKSDCAEWAGGPGHEDGLWDDNGAGVDESGTIPDEAAFAVVFIYAGANASFSLDIG
ncbi:MAG TPA: hypothetical protein VGB83_12510 [Actinomycetota bacterium]